MTPSLGRIVLSFVPPSNSFVPVSEPLQGFFELTWHPFSALKLAMQARPCEFFLFVCFNAQ